MTDKLPPQLLALFQPRPPLRYIPPQDSAPEQKATSSSTISGLASFLPRLEEYKENDDHEVTDSWLQKRDKDRHEKQQRLKAMQQDDFDGYKPDQDSKVKGDAVKTLFVGRLSYDVKDSDLEREFGQFGPIERIRIVKDETSDKPKKANRGYAFIVYEREKDMRAAYKATDGIRIRDRRVVVDVERGRMVPGWKPRRFGGGLGGRGYTKQAPAKPTLGGPSSFNSGFQGGPPGGGFRGRGGFRGGFRGGDRPGGFGGRGGIGYQGGGGGGGGYGGRQGGFQNGAPPANAPSGPGGRGPGGYDDQRNGYGGGGGGYGRDRGYGGGRDSGRDRGYDDRDRQGGGRRDDDYGSRKRYHDGDGYDDPRSKRRY